VMRVALDPPDFRTNQRLPQRHLKALGALFLQVMKCESRQGGSKLGHVALMAEDQRERVET